MMTTMQDEADGWFARTLAAALLGPMTLAGLMLVWGVVFYRGYAEEPANDAFSNGFILVAWIASILVALVGANRLRASAWLAGGSVVAGGLPIIIAMRIAIGVAACSGNWGSHRCLFS